MEGMMDEKRTTGRDTDAEEGGLAQLFVQAKCGRPARIHRQTRKKRGETMREEERRSNRLMHSHTGLLQI